MTQRHGHCLNQEDQELVQGNSDNTEYDAGKDPMLGAKTTSHRATTLDAMQPMNSTPKENEN